MGFLSSNKSELSSESINPNIYNLQKAKRGDLWFLLTFLIPLSILPVKATLNETSQTYFIVNWIFFQINLTNNSVTFLYPFHFLYTMGMDFFYNFLFSLEILLLVIAAVFYFRKLAIRLILVRWGKYAFFSLYFVKLKVFRDPKEIEASVKNYVFGAIFLQLLRYWFYPTLPGQPFYNFAMVFGAFLFTLAVFFRLKQYYDQKHGKLVESGVVGLIAVIIILLQVIRFLFSELYISEYFLETHALSWDTPGVILNNTVISPVSLFPFPYLNEFLAYIGFPNVTYPITFYLVLFALPFGLIIPIIWAYKEYRAFPPAFSNYVAKFLRFTIIFLFVIVSIFPLLYMFLVSFNNNQLLKVGLPIWPFNLNAIPTLTAWDSFAHFVTNPGYTPQESIIYTILTLLFIFLTLLSVYRRKSISSYFEHLLGEEYRVRIIELSWFVIIVLQIVAFIIVRYLLQSIIQYIGYGENGSTIFASILEILNNNIISSAGQIFIYVLLAGLVLYILALILVLVLSRGKTWLLFTNMKSFSNFFSYISIILYSIVSLGIILTNLFLMFPSGVTYINDSTFQDVLWFDIGFILITMFFWTTIRSDRRLSLIDTLEGFYLEDGFAFTLGILFAVMTVLFGILADNAYNWIYLQSDTNKAFPVGDWFFITISLCTAVSLISIVLASLSGYALSRYQFYGRGLVGGMILSTQIFPGVIMVLPVLIIFHELGLNGSLFGLGVAYSVIALPLITYLLKGFFDSIPKDLEEQAMIDGCTRMQAYRKVVLPLVLPGIASTFIFSFLAMYTEYLFALIVYQGTESTYTISLAMLKVFQADLTQRGVYYNDMAVFAVLVSLPVLFLFTYLQRYLLKGLVAGGTKG